MSDLIGHARAMNALASNLEKQAIFEQGPVASSVLIRMALAYMGASSDLTQIMRDEAGDGRKPETTDEA